MGEMELKDVIRHFEMIKESKKIEEQSKVEDMKLQALLNVIVFSEGAKGLEKINADKGYDEEIGDLSFNPNDMI